MSLDEFLKRKPLFYKEIDPKRMQRAYLHIKDKLKLPKIIHIVGTNGKGSTGRFLAGILKESGYKVGHYTSPHILKFNERIWIDGEDAKDKDLEKAHNRLQNLLCNDIIDELSYFEYTTFLAMLMFENLDYVVLEAGLGGEYDATGVFDNILTLVTTIDYDHQEFLGKTIEEIATTKLNAIKRRAVIGYQEHQEVIEIAKRYKSKFLLDEYKDFEPLCKNEGLAPFFAKNLALAIKGAREIGVEVRDIGDILKYRLLGRVQRVKNIVLDVGHNELSARAIRDVLKKDTVLVYNSYKDKNYRKILEILKPKIKRVEILDINSSRILEKSKLQKSLSELGIEYCNFNKINYDEEYLVYGSFSVVEEFLKRVGKSL